MIVKTVNLTRIYHLGASTIVALKDVNIEVEPATFVAVIGPSGSGKTTLINILGLVDCPTSGKVFYDNKDVSSLNEKERRKIRFKNIGFVFQTFNLLPTLTSLENVELPMAFTKMSQKSQREDAVKLLEAVGLASRFQHKPKELSVGEMQRVAIARALANHPSLILADEPTGELDSKIGYEIIMLLSDLCRKHGTTIIIATHDEKVMDFADNKYEIRDGEVTKLT